MRQRDRETVRLTLSVGLCSHISLERTTPSTVSSLLPSCPPPPLLTLPLTSVWTGAQLSETQKKRVTGGRRRRRVFGCCRPDPSSHLPPGDGSKQLHRPRSKTAFPPFTFFLERAFLSTAPISDRILVSFKLQNRALCTIALPVYTFINNLNVLFYSAEIKMDEWKVCFLQSLLQQHLECPCSSLWRQQT